MVSKFGRPREEEVALDRSTEQEGHRPQRALGTHALSGLINTEQTSLKVRAGNRTELG